MKIFLTGATGYIGKRVFIQLLEEGHHVVCSVRDKKRLSLKLYQNHLDKIEIIENDFLDEKSLENIPKDIDFAYYLVHSMSSSDGDFLEKEKISAENFRKALENGNVLMTDIVNFKLPFGIFGDLLAGFYVKNKVKFIFESRFKILEKIFKS